jgi:hypothetical protein
MLCFPLYVNPFDRSHHDTPLGGDKKWFRRSMEASIKMQQDANIDV